MPKSKPEVFTPMTILAGDAVPQDVRGDVAASRVMALAEGDLTGTPVTVGVVIYMRMPDGVKAEGSDVLDATQQLMQRLLDQMNAVMLERALRVVLDAAEAQDRAARQ